MILYFSQDHGCAYSIDTEGTLFYVPLYANGTLNLEEIDEVDYDATQEDDVKEIYEKLITMTKSVGEYYQTV
jgi:hypothetical protein